MIGQKLRHSAAAAARFFECLKELNHAFRVEPRRHHVVQTALVGLIFLAPRELQPNRTVCQSGDTLRGLPPFEEAQSERNNQAALLRFGLCLRPVLLANVGHLVARHPRQRIIGGQDFIQAREHKHRTAGQGKRIDFLAVQHMKLEVPRIPVRIGQGANKPLADGVKVFGTVIKDFFVLVKYLLGGLLPDLLLVCGAGRGEQPARVRLGGHQQWQGSHAHARKRGPAQESPARQTLFIFFRHYYYPSWLNSLVLFDFRRYTHAQGSLHSSNVEGIRAAGGEQRRMLPDIALEEMTLLYEAAALLGRTLDPEAIYTALREIVTRAMDCDSLIVSIYSPEDALIRCTYAWIDGHAADAAAFPPLPLDQEGGGMQSRVIRTGEPLAISDVPAAEQTQKTRYYAQPDGHLTDTPDPARPRIQSLGIVPIRLEERVLGAAQVMSYRKDAYSAAHLRLLDALLIQVAAATRNAYLYKQVQGEQAENARLLRQARLNAVRQRAFLRDVLLSVTDGRLRLCQTEADLPALLTPWAAPVPLSREGGLRDLRHQAADAAAASGLEDAQKFDLTLAVGEAGMNAVVHAGKGRGQVFWDKTTATVQVRIDDQGRGIAVENLPKAALARGYSTKETLGHGMKMILQTVQRQWLLTGPKGTTVVLEQTPAPDAGMEAVWLQDLL